MSEEKPVRIGDQEREEAVARLGAHYEAGRLTAEEHQERVGQALQAKTQTDLAALFDDLPGESTAGQAGQAAGQDEWLGPWGWARPPWTAPPDEAWAAQAWAAAGDQAGSQKAAGGGRQYGPPWMASGRGRFPLPVLIVLVAVAVVASVACTVLGGHPPVLPLC